ncbi:type VI secretion system Vgr family protein [Segetibacter sp. 3557_3]|uniref:type VI secretion system Vgr family protein n=1 Tax=Segetibacter sp. 3557_3 TaxID=2547429 RepID=UPI001404B53D|nr:phage baseplate assembly protein V [Segetibacter sp. 3557_3]
MAQFTSVNIIINGSKINKYTSLSLSQGIYEHHTFRLVCPADAISSNSNSPLESSKNLVGGSFFLRIVGVDAPGTLEFSGLVTQVEAARHGGFIGDIIISGYSPTILCDNGPHCKTWETKTIRDIADDVFSHFTKSLSKPQISPLCNETFFYVVQYKETAWQFISRLSAGFGEWLFYDGKQLVLGTPKGEAVNLVYGSSLTSFNTMMQLRPTRFQLKGYDYTNNEAYDVTPAAIASKAGLNDLGQYAFQISGQFFDTQPKQWQNQFLTDKKQLNDVAEMRAILESSNMVRFSGTAGHPGIQVGGTVKVQELQKSGFNDQSSGEYRVISVHHHCSGEGKYSNDFIAIPASVTVPPIGIYAEPNCETQSAIVTDNHDLEGLGRIRVRFHWMKTTEKTPWLRVITPYAGDGKGFYFMPEIGEEVIVGFEGNSPVKPYVVGSVSHSKAKNEYSNIGNDNKVIRTRDGIEIMMNDKEGSIHIADSKGNNTIWDGKGNINVTSSESIVITCGESKIELLKDGTINITGTKVNTSAIEKASMVSGQASFTASGNSNEVSMEGATSNVAGSSETKIKSDGGNVVVEGVQIILN